MPTLWTILAFLALYLLVGTLLFALMEKLPIHQKYKIVYLMIGHPVLTGLLLWIAFSFVNAGMATTILILVAGASLRNAFSDAKFFVSLTKDENGLSIDYLTPLLRPKTLIVPLTAVKTFTLSSGKRIVDKPTQLKLTFEERTTKFYVLGKVRDQFSLL